MLKGQKMSEEQKDIIRKAQIGRISPMKGKHYIYKGPKIPDICWCGKCNNVVWNGNRYISGHNYPTQKPEASEKYSIIFKKLWEDEEHIKTMSDNLKNRWANEELRKELKHSPWNKGKSVMCGKENPFYGKHHTEESKQKNREKHIGEKSANWQGGISYYPYCEKFNNHKKEEIRNKYNRLCLNCGKDEITNGKKHPVHHIYYDKEEGCKGKDFNLIPLCNSCHMKANYNRTYWEEHYKYLVKLWNIKEFMQKEF